MSSWDQQSAFIKMSRQRRPCFVTSPNGRLLKKHCLRAKTNFACWLKPLPRPYIIIQGTAVVYANPAAETMCGYTFAEMQSHDFWDFVHPEHRERVGEWGRRRQQGEDLPSHYEVKLLTRGGTELWVDYTAAVIEYQGKPAVLGTGADITDRKRAEEALRRGEEKYRMLVQSANSIILRMDQHGAIIFLNEFGQQFFGFSEDEILGKNVIGTIVPQTDTLGSNLEEMILDIGRHPECYAVNENENMLRNGKRVWVSWTNKAILDDAGTISEILCIGHDITARKRAEEKLLSYQKQLQSLASELSLAEERERRRIAVELHDSIAQNLAISKIKISELREMTDHNSCGHIIDEIDLILQQTIRETRSLSFELCPPFLYELGFETALEWLAEQTSKKHGIALHFESDKQPKPLADDIRVVLFQATRELLANIAKHARARSGRYP